MFTDQQKQNYVNQLTAFMHANVDGEVVLVEARHKALGIEVLLGCIERMVTIPPRVMGGEATYAKQIVPIFQFVDPEGDNPYESMEADIAEVPESPILRANAHEPLRLVRDTAA